METEGTSGVYRDVAFAEGSGHRRYEPEGERDDMVNAGVSAVDMDAGHLDGAGHRRYEPEGERDHMVDEGTSGITSDAAFQQGAGHRRYESQGHRDHAVIEGSAMERQYGKRRVVPDHMVAGATEVDARGKRHIPVGDNRSEWIPTTYDNMMSSGVSDPQNTVMGTGEGRRHIKVPDHMLT
jgi:hypothetical protein